MPINNATMQDNHLLIASFISCFLVFEVNSIEWSVQTQRLASITTISAEDPLMANIIIFLSNKLVSNYGP